MGNIISWFYGITPDIKKSTDIKISPTHDIKKSTDIKKPPAEELKKITFLNRRIPSGLKSCVELMHERSLAGEKSCKYSDLTDEDKKKLQDAGYTVIDNADDLHNLNWLVN